MPQVITDVTRVINAPIEEIWGIVTSFGAEALWFPGIVKSSLEGYGPGSVRTLHFDNSNPWIRQVREKMDMCDPDKHIIRWKVFNNNTAELGELYSSIVLEDIDGKSTKFRWFAEGEPMPDAAQHASMKEHVEGMYNRCADAIDAKLAPK